LNLSPLLRLPRLSALRLSDIPSPPQIAVVQRLAALTTVTTLDETGSWGRAALLALLEPPHSLQRLQEVEFGFDVIADPPLLEGLLSLPALTALRPDWTRPECWAGLGGSPQLRSLTVHWAATSPRSSGPHSSRRSTRCRSCPTSPCGWPPIDCVGGRRWLCDCPRCAACAFLPCACRRWPFCSTRHWSSGCTWPAAADWRPTTRCAVCAPSRRACAASSSAAACSLSAEQEPLLCPPSALLPALAGFAYLPL